MAGVYRTVDVGIWQDVWFEELEPGAKLLFFYLLTNNRQTPCGAFAVSLRSICHETGLTPEQVRDGMAALVAAGKVAWWPDDNWVFLVRFFKRQRAQSSEKYTVAARHATADLPSHVRAIVETQYPELATLSDPSPTPPDTLSIPYPEGMDSPLRAKQKQNQETESVPESETGEGGPGGEPQATPARRGKRRAPPTYPADFLAFWTRYPPAGREDQPGTYLEYKRQRPPPDDLAAGMGRWEVSERWASGFIVNTKRFLKERRWEANPEAASGKAKQNGHHPGREPSTKSELAAFWSDYNGATAAEPGPGMPPLQGSRVAGSSPSGRPEQRDG